MLEAVSGLTYLDLVAKDTASAISRLEAEIAKQPANAALFALLARAHNVAGDKAKVEQALRQRGDGRSSLYGWLHGMLAQLYLATEAD